MINLIALAQTMEFENSMHLMFNYDNNIIFKSCFPDNSEAGEQQKHSEPQVQTSSAANALAHPGISPPNFQYATPQLGAGHAMVFSTEQNFVNNCCVFVKGYVILPRVAFRYIPRVFFVSYFGV
jgi:hypothetical protein